MEGLIEKRDEETYNPKIPTGTIELDAKEVTVLGEVYSQLPFEVMTSKSVHEDCLLYTSRVCQSILGFFDRVWF